MAIEVIGSIGIRLDLLIKQGSTFSFSGQLQNPDLTPVVLTGATLRAQIRSKALDTAVVATFVFTYPNAAQGQWEASLTDEVTAAIVTGEQMAARSSKFTWDMEMEDTLGRVIPLYYGDVTVFREVTRV